MAEARQLARRACAPPLACIASWAEAVALTRVGRSAEALAKARRAASRLEKAGEPYTGARLLTDLLPRLEPAVADEASADLAGRLEGMGAHASASEARGERRV
jgi:hypothetical protein